MSLAHLNRFPKVAREPLYAQVARHIQELIVSGELKVDDRLPPESKLCEQFGVSRTVIREATRSLIDRGLLSSEPRRGTFVTAITPQAFSHSFGLFVKSAEIPLADLIEARETLEMKTARLAAERATTEDLDMLQQAIDEMDQNLELPGQFLNADLDYHMALVKAAHNEILFALVNSFMDELSYIQRASADTETGLRLAQQSHREIHESIKSGDGEGAAQAMRRHLQVVSRYLEAGCSDE